MTNMITDGLKVVDYAARQDGHWLFLLALMLLLGFAYFVIRGLVKDRDELAKDAKADRERYQAALSQMISEHNKLSVDFKISMDRNTEALRVNNSLLDKLNRKET